jgi:hypothetical protein
MLGLTIVLPQVVARLHKNVLFTSSLQIAKNGLNSSPFFTKQLGFTAHLLLRLFRSTASITSKTGLKILFSEICIWIGLWN